VVQVLVNTETGVQYMATVDTNGQSSVCPLLDASGIPYVNRDILAEDTNGKGGLS